ncbi:hypothetical protein [Alysiella crassa]|nr:hypothetical protein [Alysiella crassa]UOP06737.1 hypothetical protein LVJ80_13585 [Alysiella crassa]
MRTKWLESLKYCGGFGTHGAPYCYFYRVLSGSLKTHFIIFKEIKS